MLSRFADDLWTLEGTPIGYWAPPIPVKLRYGIRSVIVRLGDGSLFVDSPVQLTDEVRGELDPLGPVRHIVSPNKLHHLHMGEWAAAYPDAQLHASPKLPAKRPDLSFATTLGDAPCEAWASDLDQCLFRGSVFMAEVVFFHRASATLILGDMIENHDPEVLGSRAQRWFARMNRMLAPNGTTPVNFRLTFPRRAPARASLATIRAWNPERVIMLHGPCVRDGAEEFLRRGFAWLD